MADVGVRKQVDNKIVKASPDDASEILDPQKVAYQKEAVLYDDWNIPPLIQTNSEIHKEFEKRAFLKAIICSRIVGSVRASLDSNTCMVGRLIVHPDFQRNGIGSLLMTNIENEFSCAKRFELFTGIKSVDNIRLYQQIGYKEYREQKLSPKVQIVYMEKLK